MVTVSGYHQVLSGELPSGDLLDALLSRLPSEDSPALLEPFLSLSDQLASSFTPVAEIRGRQGGVADVALALTERPDLVTAARRTLAATATGDEHFAALGGPASEETDLAWRVLVRRAALGDYDEQAVDALLERDRDPDAVVRRLIVRAARPDAAAKDEAWSAVYDDNAVPMGQMLGMMRQAIWQPAQSELLLPLTHRYLAGLPALAGSGMLRTLSLVRGMFPTVGDSAFLERAATIAGEPETDATVRSALIGGSDTLRRMLRARGA